MINVCDYNQKYLVNRAKKITPVIVQVGVGGTGSNLSQQIGQMLATIF